MSANILLRYSTKKVHYLFYFLIVSATIIVAFASVLHFSEFGSLPGYTIIPAVGALISIAFFIWLLMKDRAHPQNLFLMIAIPACISFSLFMMPNYVPDEIWHIFRIFDIFDNGNSLMAPAVLDLTLLPHTYADLAAALHEPANYSNEFFVDRQFAAYSPILYLTPGLFVSFGKILQINPFLLILIARLINAALFIAAGYWIIKRIPFGKAIAFVYLLNPMLIQQQSSCSADAITNIIALLFVTLLLVVYSQEKPSRPTIVILMLLFISLFFAKIAYAPLGLLFFLFFPRIKSRLSRNIVIVAFALFVLLCVLALVMIPASETTIGYMIGLLKNPADFIVVTMHAVYSFLESWIETFAGSALGALNIPLWLPFIWAYYAVLLSTVFVSTKERLSLSFFGKAVFVITAIVLSALLIAAFREWSVVVHQMYDNITGVQGRYFIPIALLVLLAAFNHKKYIERPACFVFYSAFCATFLLYSSLMVIRFFL